MGKNVQGGKKVNERGLEGNGYWMTLKNTTKTKKNQVAK